MALLIYYRQVSDSPSEAEYRYGGTWEHMDRLLVIDKATFTARSDQPEDATFHTTAGYIMAKANREKEWPAHGMIAS